MPLAPGKIVENRYEVVEEIGHGGMQRVWLAKDLSLERTVALKVPITPGAEKRFAESARLVARVRHANVAAALDYVADAEGEYYVEEYIAGSNLQVCMDENFPRLDADTCARVLHHLAKGVAASHRVNVAHRDLKPSNVMVSGDLTFQMVKITDFGIAKLAQSQIEAETARMTTAGNTEGLSSTMLGAIPFLAPEVLRKGRKGVSPIGLPSDIWSLGAMGYWLLAGDFPFDTGMDAVANILNSNMTQWDPLITASKMTASLAGELQTIITSCMVADPASRPSADDLARRLAALGYFSGVRSVGTITESGKHGGVWFGRADSGHVFMTHNAETLPGTRLEVGAKVSYIACSGEPFSRAVAVIRLK